jgi:hypothetical protein
MLAPFYGSPSPDGAGEPLIHGLVTINGTTAVPRHGLVDCESPRRLLVLACCGTTEGLRDIGWLRTRLGCAACESIFTQPKEEL